MKIFRTNFSEHFLKLSFLYLSNFSCCRCHCWLNIAITTHLNILNLQVCMHAFNDRHGHSFFFEQNKHNVFEQTKLVVNDGVVQKKDLLNDSVKKERNWWKMINNFENERNQFYLNFWKKKLRTKWVVHSRSRTMNERNEKAKRASIT